MGGRGGAHTAKQIGTGRGHTPHPFVCASLQHLMRQRVRGAAQAHRILSACCCSRHVFMSRQDESEWARPKMRHQSLRKHGHVTGKFFDFIGRCHMNDQRMIRWPAFGFENFGHGTCIAGIGCQAIHCFCRQTYKLACTQSINSLLHIQGKSARNDHGSVNQLQSARNLKSLDAQNGCSLQGHLAHL